MSRLIQRHPCVHCGERELLLCLFDDAGQHPRIHCMQCGGMGPIGKDAREAVLFWNGTQRAQEGKKATEEPV